MHRNPSHTGAQKPQSHRCPEAPVTQVHRSPSHTGAQKPQSHRCTETPVTQVHRNPRHTGVQKPQAHRCTEAPGAQVYRNPRHTGVQKPQVHRHTGFSVYTRARSSQRLFIVKQGLVCRLIPSNSSYFDPFLIRCGAWKEAVKSPNWSRSSV